MNSDRMGGGQALFWHVQPICREFPHEPARADPMLKFHVVFKISRKMSLKMTIFGPPNRKVGTKQAIASSILLQI